MKTFAKTIGCLVIAVGMTTPAMAQHEAAQKSTAKQNKIVEEKVTNVDGMVGILATGQQGLDTSINFGVGVGYKPTRTIGTGLSLSFYHTSDQVGTLSSSTSLVPILLETSVYLGTAVGGGDALQGLRIGTKEGIHIRSSNITAGGVVTDTSSTNFAFGPFAGYDIFLAKNVSVGAEVSLIRVFESTGFNETNTQGIFKYWM